MAHKTRAEQINEQSKDHVDHQVKHKGKSPKVYKRRRVDVRKYLDKVKGESDA